MRKKLLMSVLTAALTFATLCGSMPVQAEETSQVTVEAEEETGSEALEDDPEAFRAEGEADDDFYDEAEEGALLRSSRDSGYTHNSRFNGMEVKDVIDVSYYQKDIDWNAVRSSGIEYAIIRVGYRGYSNGALKDDPNFTKNITGALNAGLKVGVYIFSQAISTDEAVEEANFILGKISGYNITLPVAMDFEYVSQAANKGRLYQAGLSREAATAVCSAFCDRVAGAGYTPMIYANKNMLNDQVDANTLGSKYKIWLANYTNCTDYAGAYTFWQYSSNGSVNGIAGRVDMNFWYDGNTQQTEKVTVDEEKAAGFIRGLYQYVLDRTAEQSEVDYWVSELKNGRTGAETAHGFIFSDEFKNHNYDDADYVEHLYLSLMGRSSDEAGKENWITYLANGVSREYIFKQFVDSDEFCGLCNNYGIKQGTITLNEARDINYNVTRFMVRNYREFLGRSYDVDGLNDWCGKINRKEYTLEQVAYGFVFSDECKNMNLSNEDFVKMLYRGFFDREADDAGLSDWTARLNAGTSKDDVFWGFANSQEFTNLVASYGL